LQFIHEDRVYHDELLRVSESNGKFLIVYSNPDSRSEKRLRQRLEQHLKELSPLDRRLISYFCTGIRTFTRFDLSLLQQQPKALMQLGDWGKLARKMLPFICPLARWGNLSAPNYDYWAMGGTRWECASGGNVGTQYYSANLSGRQADFSDNDTLK
jgi:hypothetical protein